MKQFMALLCGTLFGTGLMLSGLADPAKVISFLNLSLLLTGEWDPSLMFVMSAALAVYLPIYLLVVKPRVLAKQGPVCDKQYHLPTKRTIDAPLLIGSVLFGLGWGMVGICPGPGIVNLASFEPSIFLFVFAMVLGGYMGRQINLSIPIAVNNT
ncbi:YeeE/YedE family protein [Shewanella mesophila]|uniref:YeeE/YedE family protein n=1 Tax=Shewanella mesophila TaxID=2864208 RepID=UPI001C65BC69|nr:YeeE/YedE family protein [Shewanella mesophila]QYJ85615.1 YeeE/YedE family protein [Shewanella mesophila]